MTQPLKSRTLRMALRISFSETSTELSITREQISRVTDPGSRPPAVLSDSARAWERPPASGDGACSADGLRGGAGGAHTSRVEGGGPRPPGRREGEGEEGLLVAAADVVDGAGHRDLPELKKHYPPATRN